MAHAHAVRTRLPCTESATNEVDIASRSSMIMQWVLDHTHTKIPTQVACPYRFFIKWYHKIVTGFFHLLYRFRSWDSNNSSLVVILDN